MSGASLRPLGGFLLLVLQLATASAWSVLEARVDAEARKAHIEQAGDPDCPPPHDEALCRLCQVEANRLPPSGPSVLPLANPAWSPVGPAASDHSRAFPILSAGAPRAPPAVA